ncbi:hypothetical protein FQN54_007848 [Arachnomyces sp. PD_36]|nr:hypothetical protein FQN54_007848 [Arachnomyces sp. PD_36]
MVEHDISHQAISAYFIGPQAENLDLFRQNIDTILDEIRDARLKYFPEDGQYITPSVKESDEFKRVTNNFSNAIRKAANMMGKHSIPFWSPRYEAHMSTDMSMPSLLGYFMTMIYNPNNVAIEASPLTTIAEIEVGEQLCNLFGYNIDPNRTDVPLAWGHVTSGGTVANLESMWVARNFKFYPLSLRMAMDKGGLQFVADKFKVQTCNGDRKLLKDLSTWELLNLRPKTVLDLPQLLNEQCGISPQYLESVLDEYNIQTLGKDALERYFEITPEKPIVYMLGKSRHYSWPKGGATPFYTCFLGTKITVAAVSGIGSKNIVGIEVDDGARIDLENLEKHLQSCIDNEQAVYAVVAIMGSTEEGAVDRLSHILSMRQRFQAEGLSFLVHADAAWGGYFATMLPRDIMDMPDETGMAIPSEGIDAGLEGFVPDLSLKIETQEDLMALRYADSITVDPHKSGYIPYPAGSLVYRDGRIRHMVTWTAPVLSRGSVTSIGIFGVEGSKPGAAAMSTWLSNKCIGLDQEGYGALLSEVSFSCARLSANWAAMTTDEDNFICVPFHKLPSEKDPNSTPADVEAEKQRIRDTILGKTNREIVQSDIGKPVEEKSMTLLRNLGSDLNINALALNFKHKNGELNTDIEEANYLMQRVIERLSVDSPDDDPTTIPFYLTSTEFSPELYGKCVETFKRRLGLEESPYSLFVLRNVVMSPFPTDKMFFRSIMNTFRTVVEEEVEVCRQRNDMGPSYHNFLMQGTDEVYLVYLPSFHLARHRRQLILRVKLSEQDMKVYTRIKNANLQNQILLKTSQTVCLDQVLEDFKGGKSTFLGTLYTESEGPINTLMEVTITDVVKNRPLSSMHRDTCYPSGHMPFYLYGTGSQYHMSHVLLMSPNIALRAGNVKLEVDNTDAVNKELQRGVILSLSDVHEASRQPFPERNADLPRDFFFRQGQQFQVTVWRDPREASEGARGLMQEVFEDDKKSNLLATGTVELSEDVQVDSESVNKDIFKRYDKVTRWREEFDKIGKELKPRAV